MRRTPTRLRTPKVLVLVAVAVALVAIPTGDAGALLPRSFGPGELLLYDVSYGPVHTGQARVAVGASSVLDARPVWPIVVQARTNGVFSKVYAIRDKVVSFWTPEEQRSLGFDMHANENGYRKFTRMRLDPGEGKALVERRSPGEAAQKKSYEVGDARHDVASAVFWLRTRPLALGDREKIGIFTGSRTWDMIATVEGKEAVETAAGRFETVRVRLRTSFSGKLAAKRDIVVWMTDDPAHVPVRAEAELVLGSVHADLARYLPGVSR